MLSTVTWTAAAGGSWSAATNWSTHAAPKAGDTVVINKTGNLQITLTGAVSIGSLTLTGDTLIIAAGASLTTIGAVSNHGTINVAASGKISVGGAYTEAAGATLSMPGAAAGQGANLLANPDFESPVIASNGVTPPSGWSRYGSAYLSKQYAYTGLQSVQTSGANAGLMQTFSATPGASYVLSAYAMTPTTAKLTGTEDGAMALDFFTSKGVQINANKSPYVLRVLTSSSKTGGSLAGDIGGQGWNLFSETIVAPANAATVRAMLTVGAFNGTGAGGGSVYWDAPKFGSKVIGTSSVSAGSISNAGTIVVGPANTLTSHGAFSQTATGTLDLQLGGTPASKAFGSVSSTGAASFAGTLKADIVNGYVPATTDIFTVMTYPSETGTFAAYSLGGTASAQFQGAVTFTNITLAAAPTAPLSVDVDLSSYLHPVNTNLLGVNTDWWDSAITTAQTQQLIQQAGFTIYRFPAGSSSDLYHFNLAGNTLSSPQGSWQTVPTFGLVTEKLGAPAMFVVDYGSGSPQEGAAELAYFEGSPTDTTPLGMGIEWLYLKSTTWMNVDWGTVGYWASLRSAAPLATDDGLNFLRINHPAPFSNIRYAEIGNEEYGAWEVDHHGTPAPGSVSTGAQHDPATYAAFAATFAAFANEITTAAGLPNISIGIDSQNPTGLIDNNFTEKVLVDGYALGFVPGYISDHNYAQVPGQESDATLLNNTVSNPTNILDWNVRYADYESLLEQALGAQASNVVVMATEFNSVNVKPGKQITSLVNGLYVADSLGSLLDSGYSAGFIWDLRNNGFMTNGNNNAALYGWREGGDYGILGSSNTNNPPTSGTYIAYPDYFAEELASKLIVNGGEVESVNSNYQDLHAYAVLEADGHLRLMVINTNPAAGLTEQFNLNGFTPSGDAQIWQYGKNEDTAQSQTTDGAAALTNFSTTVSLAGGGFSYTLPAYSMTVIDLTPASAPANSVAVTKALKKP